jgi:hypothetical protein
MRKRHLHCVYCKISCQNVYTLLGLERSLEKYLAWLQLIVTEQSDTELKCPCI